MTCSHCKAPLVEGARFCPSCGNASAPTEADAGASSAAAGAPDLLGKEIAGRYRVLQKLGEGGMGAVYRAEQIALRRAVAVKVLRPELGAQPHLLQRFNAEAQAVAKLSHPNTVNIFDYGHDVDGTLFIAMEFIDGRSLREVLRVDGPLSVPRALAIATQVAAALSDAHAHAIVHRDLKPDNVMLQERGKQRDVVRVLDFGIAKLRDDSRATQAAMTQAGDMLGTPQYMAPEQIRGEQIDGRTDVYALGCMIYEMVTARLPFEAPTVMAMLSRHLLETPVPPTQRRPDLRLPPSIDALVLSAMAKRPEDRPATMDAFSDVIGALLASQPDAATSGGHVPGGAVASAPSLPSAAYGQPGGAQPATHTPATGGPLPVTVATIGAPALALGATGQPAASLASAGAAVPASYAPGAPAAASAWTPPAAHPHAPATDHAPALAHALAPAAPPAPNVATGAAAPARRAGLLALLGLLVLAGGSAAAYLTLRGGRGAAPGATTDAAAGAADPWAAPSGSPPPDAPDPWEPAANGAQPSPLDQP